MANEARILVVCTGNQRRSPSIELLLRHGTASAIGLDPRIVAVSSAGVRAEAGTPVDPLIVEELSRRGITELDTVSRQLTAAEVESADLVITAEREHRTAATRLWPQAVRRVFTLHELAFLGSRLGRAALGGRGSDSAERLRTLVQLAPQERVWLGQRKAADDDLADLRRGTQRAARRMLDEATESVEILLQLLEPEPALSLVVSVKDARDLDESGGASSSSVS